MQHLVILTGAGISAESGIKTFRDAGDLWEGHRIEHVASPEGFIRNPTLVLDFYNQRRRQLEEVTPNEAHQLLVELEKYFQVTVITQNVDDLHERAGSKNTIHLHGELRWGCSSRNRELRTFLGSKDIGLGDKAPDGSQLRPDIVWFGEAVPKMELALDAVLKADIFLVVGTSLEVYPAAGLVHYVPSNKPIYIIDPNHHGKMQNHQISVISEIASIGIKQLFAILVPDKHD
jgi:NAD-dependent deacetylase